MSSIAPYLMLLSEVKNGGGGGGGADDRFFSVKITTTAGSPEDVSVCDKSSTEILDAIDAGKILIVTEENIKASPEDSYTYSFIPTTTSTMGGPGGILLISLHNSYVNVDSGCLTGVDESFLIDGAKSVTYESKEIELSDK